MQIELRRFQARLRGRNVGVRLSQRCDGLLELLWARNIAPAQLLLPVSLLPCTQLGSRGASQGGLRAFDLHFEGLRIDPVEHLTFLYEAALREHPLDHDAGHTWAHLCDPHRRDAAGELFQDWQVLLLGRYDANGHRRRRGRRIRRGCGKAGHEKGGSSHSILEER